MEGYEEELESYSICSGESLIPAQYINNVYLSESKRSGEYLFKMMGLSILFHDG